jgi:predicted Fe-Mo cluster-binding NifX family protein
VVIAVKIAIPVWNGRVSPVFDVAKAIRVVDVDVGRGCVSDGSIHPVELGRPVSTLTALSVDVLVCSAVSPPIEAAVWVSGIEVISDICGSPDDILKALASGDTELSRFRSPGSRRRRGPSNGKTPNQERRKNGGHSVESS